MEKYHAICNEDLDHNEMEYLSSGRLSGSSLVGFRILTLQMAALDVALPHIENLNYIYH